MCFCIRYENPTTNKMRVNKAAFSSARNGIMPIGAYLFCLEDCYATAIVALTAYTMEEIIYKMIITIQSTRLFYRAILKWNGLILENKTRSELKDHFYEAYKAFLTTRFMDQRHSIPFQTI